MNKPCFIFWLLNFHIPVAQQSHFPLGTSGIMVSWHLQCGPVISWFINHSNYMVISTINYSYWSYVHQLSYRKRGPHFVSCLPASLYHKDGRMDFRLPCEAMRKAMPVKGLIQLRRRLCSCAAVQLCSKRWI